MAASMVVLLQLHDTAWLDDYGANVPAIVRRHGGKYRAIAKPGSIVQAEGTGVPPDAVVLFDFPTVAAAQAFLAAPDYQPYRQARMAGSDSDIFLFDNDDDAPQLTG